MLYLQQLPFQSLRRAILVQALVHASKYRRDLVSPEILPSLQEGGVDAKNGEFIKHLGDDVRDRVHLHLRIQQLLSCQLFPKQVAMMIM